MLNYLPSYQLVQDGLGIGRVDALQILLVGSLHTRHDLVNLVHGGRARKEGLPYNQITIINGYMHTSHMLCMLWTGVLAAVSLKMGTSKNTPRRPADS